MTTVAHLAGVVAQVCLDPSLVGGHCSARPPPPHCTALLHLSIHNYGMLFYATLHCFICQFIALHSQVPHSAQPGPPHCTNIIPLNRTASSTTVHCYTCLFTMLRCSSIGHKTECGYLCRSPHALFIEHYTALKQDHFDDPHSLH